MTRSKIIAGAIILSVAAAALPLTAMYLLGRYRAAETEKRHLTDYGNWTIMRANISYDDAVAALKEIEAQGFKDCSQAHIDAMRIAAVNHRAIEEMGFYKDGMLACTSWGKATRVIQQRPVDYQRADGIGVNLSVKPVVSRGHTMIGVEYGSHNALVDPIRMVDVLVDNEMSLALANDQGAVLATLNSPDSGLVQYAVSHPGAGENGPFLYASYRANGWIAVAIEHRRYTNADFEHQRATLLPLGILMAAIMIAGIMWALRRRLSPLAELEIAVRKKEFIAFYQPIVELATGRCVGAEALIRWIRPDGKMIPPNHFIPLAEESGLIRPITDLMMERVLDEMQHILRADPEIHIAINLCADDIETGRPLPVLLALVAERNLPSDCIWLEATERGFIKAAAARSTLNLARTQGHSIAIDDFGTGYSSLAMLHTLPLDALKIDKAFVDAIGTESATSTVTGHIIGMAAELQLDVIAEGIETEVQAAYLIEHNVRFGQGWLYAKAMRPVDFIAYYRAHASSESRQVQPAGVSTV